MKVMDVSELDLKDIFRPRQQISCVLSGIVTLEGNRQFANRLWQVVKRFYGKEITFINIELNQFKKGKLNEIVTNPAHMLTCSIYMFTYSVDKWLRFLEMVVILFIFWFSYRIN